jgi:hypothetical protein
VSKGSPLSIPGILLRFLDGRLLLIVIFFSTTERGEGGLSAQVDRNLNVGRFLTCFVSLYDSRRGREGIEFAGKSLPSRHDVSNSKDDTQTQGEFRMESFIL